MNFELGNVLGRTWKIGWAYKTLWLIQLAPGLFMLLITPLFPLLSPLFGFLQPVPVSGPAYMPLSYPAAAVLMLLVIAAYLALMAFVHPATMLGALRMEKGARKLPLRDLLERSLSYYWSMLGLYLLFLGAWAVVLFLFGGLAALLGNSSRVLELLCMLPVWIVLSAAGLAGYGLMQLAQAGILSDDLSLWEALSRAAGLFRKHLPAILVFMLLLYLGFFVISMVFLVPVLPGIMATTWLTGASWGLTRSLPSLFVDVLPLVVLLLILLQGILMVFFQAAWAVAYSRLVPREERLPHPPVTAA